ncbi:hypothetical protein, partial [Escherichia coli]|uniref:hypothetical protein n=1 Tax=Escherichia coli TaxID=562 RepID=UPI004056C8D2
WKPLLHNKYLLEHRNKQFISILAQMVIIVIDWSTIFASPAATIHPIAANQTPQPQSIENYFAHRYKLAIPLTANATDRSSK